MSELRIAVFADVHGNVPALQAVLEDIRRRGPYDEVIAAGDYCLKGPEPARAFEIAREAAGRLLIGNTDQDICNASRGCIRSNGRRRAAIEWALDQVGPGVAEQLGQLDFEALIEAPDGSRLHVVHANPKDLTTHILPQMTDEEVENLVGDSPAEILAFGHLHIAYTRLVNKRQLFDIAACGLPQDGDRRAVWGEFVWSSEAGWRGAIRRVDYDFGETALRILDSGMPHPKKRLRDLLSASYE